MEKSTYLNKKYSELCQQLGDAYLKKERLSEHIKNLKNQIEVLDKSFTVMTECEALANKKGIENE